MSRPANVVVVAGNMVYSIAPGKFKAMLAARVAGTPFPAEIGKSVGPVFANVGDMTDTEATALMARLFPAPVPVVVAAAPVPVPAPAATEEATPTVTIAA